MAAAGGSWVTSKSGRSHRFVSKKQKKILELRGQNIKKIGNKNYIIGNPDLIHKGK